MGDDDSVLRLKAFEFLEEQSSIYGDVLPRSVLQAGFEYEGRRVPLVGPQGIFKPAAMSDLPLSITTAPRQKGRTRPYDDEFTEDGWILYKYRGTDPNHHENVGLRRAMESQTPLIYFHGVVPGQYAAAWPVFIVGDDPSTLSFRAAVDEAGRLTISPTPTDEGRRAYVTALTRRRLHQAGFRERVIAAYQRMCAVCRLRHEELLDAAHILPDIHPRGTPEVTNGLALCKLHHAAFDQNIIGIRPDLRIEIATRVLEEIDGPMLTHGLQGFHGELLLIPRKASSQPDPTRLEERYQIFRQAI